MKVNIGPYISPDSRKKRKINIHIDNYDLWNMDETLSLIIAPMLVKMKNDKEGVPHVHDEDLPEHILQEYPESNNDLAALEARWNYIIDAMIFSFEMYNTDWENQFFGRGLDSELKREYYEIEKRIELGFRLFGKYFRSLWT
jgi:hypothetical protein